MNAHQKLAIRLLEYKRGDSAEKLRRAFAFYDPHDMKKVYKSTGKTRAQALAEAEARAKEYDDAIEWIRNAR
jgi:hypothetical protein